MKTDTVSSSITYRFWLILIAFIILMIIQTAVSKAGATQLSTDSDQKTTEEFAWTPESENDPYKIKKFRVSGPVNVDVSTPGGHINVKQGKSDEVEIQLFVKTGYSFFGGSDFNPKDYNIIIDQTGNTIKAIVETRSRTGRWGRNNPSFHFDVYVPADASTNLRTSGGHITLEGVNGRQQIRTSGGHITINDSRGDVNAQTSGGHMTIKNFEGILNGRTSGGHITMDGVEGEIKVKTSGGHIRANSVAGNVDAATSGGNINCVVVNELHRLVLRTSGGNISVEVPKSDGFEVNMRGSSVSMVPMENFTGSSERNRIVGTVGTGGRVIELATSGGRVSLNINK